MIILNMQEKQLFVKIPITAFSLETNVVKLELKMLNGDADYSLEDKTVTAKFSKTGLETEPLTIADGIIQLPITNDLVKNGENQIQLIFYWGAIREESPIMTWLILDSIKTTGLEQHAVDVASWLITTMANVEKEEENRVAAENARVVTENEIIAAEGTRVNAESARTQAETEREQITNKTLEELKKVQKSELDYQFEHENVFTEKSTGISKDGIGFVSDPNTYMMMQIGGQSSGGLFNPYIAGFTNKGLMKDYTGEAIKGVTECRMGCYLNYFNFLDGSGINVLTKWKRNKDGLPIPFVDYSYSRRDQELDFKSQCFSQGETVFVPCVIQGKPGMRWSLKVDKNDINMVHYVSMQEKGEAHILVMTIADSPTKYVFAQYPCNGWYIADNFEDVTTNDFSGADTHISTTSISFGLSYANAVWRNVKTCYVMSMPSSTMSDADIQTKIVEDLINWEDKEQLALTYWDNFWNEYSDRWNNVDSEIKSRGLIAVQQIAANTYKGGLCSGMPMWNEDFIRDSAWALKALAPVVPTFCKERLNWLKNATLVAGVNKHTLDGYTSENYNHNTENVAVMLIGLGTLWSNMPVVNEFNGLLPQIQSALEYIKINYNTTDKHILAKHPHDYWDDYPGYGGEMDVTLVKYESVVDVLWSHGLKMIAPLLLALGDVENSNYCDEISSMLLLGLEDYRELNGSLQYAIKTDGTLYNSIVASPGTIYASYLLDDILCTNSLKDKELTRRLGVKYMSVDATVCFSNYRDSDSVTNKLRVWGPHVPMVAGEFAKIGDFSLLPIIKNSMKFGSWGEDLAVQENYNDKLMFNDLAINFIWGLAELISLCDRLNGM